MSLLERCLRRAVKHHTIEIDGKPYLTRYYLIGGRGEDRKRSVWLHHFHMSDAGSDLHNHPWAGTSLILAGGYVEERCSATGEIMVPIPGVRLYEDEYARVQTYTAIRTRVYLPGSINEIGLLDFHRATLIDEEAGCWTMFFAGARVKDWGFLDYETGTFTPRTAVGAIP